MKDKTKNQMNLLDYAHRSNLNEKEKAFLKECKVDLNLERFQITSMNWDTVYIKDLDSIILEAMKEYLPKHPKHQTFKFWFVDFKVPGLLQNILNLMFEFMIDYQEILNVSIFYSKDKETIKLPESLNKTSVKSLYFEHCDFIVAFNDKAISHLYSFGANVNTQGLEVLLKSKNMRHLNLFIEKIENLIPIHNEVLETISISTSEHYSKLKRVIKNLHNLKNVSYYYEEVYDG